MKPKDTKKKDKSLNSIHTKTITFWITNKHPDKSTLNYYPI